MKSGGIRSIGEHVLVATAAQRILTERIIRSVTAVTALLNAGMSLDERARHDQSLDVEHLRFGTASREQTHADHRKKKKTDNVANEYIVHQ